MLCLSAVSIRLVSILVAVWTLSGSVVFERASSISEEECQSALL